MYNVECNGKHYTMKTPLTVGEVKAIWKTLESNALLSAEKMKDPVEYAKFAADQHYRWDKLVGATLKKCLGLTEEDFNKMSSIEAHALFNAILTFRAEITKIQGDNQK